MAANVLAMMALSKINTRLVKRLGIDTTLRTAPFLIGLTSTGPYRA